MKKQYSDAIIRGVTARDFPPLPVDYGYHDSKNFWFHRKRRMRAELLQVRKASLDSVRYAADRVDDKVKFTDDALETILGVPRVFLPTVLKGCVAWAKENNVELVTAEHMKISVYSVPMALADFIPVLLFGAAAVLLQRDLYSKMVKGAYALFAAGTINVFMAGFLKALYKLLYALEVCDFQPLTQMFFPLQALGFLMAGCGALYIGTKKAKGEKAFAVAALPVYKGTFVFVGLMVAGLGMMDFGLVRTAKKMRQSLACTLFIVSFVFSLGG